AATVGFAFGGHQRLALRADNQRAQLVAGVDEQVAFVARLVSLGIAVVQADAVASGQLFQDFGALARPLGVSDLEQFRLDGRYLGVVFGEQRDDGNLLFAVAGLGFLRGEQRVGVVEADVLDAIGHGLGFLSL